MVIPIYDGNPFAFKAPPYASWGLIAANFIVFIWEIVSGAGEINSHTASVMSLTFRPDSVLADQPLLGASPPWPATLLTYTFIHGNWLHLIGNMMFLWVFGDDVEAALGRVRFLVFYFLCGIAGALAHFAANPTSHLPLLGASGAVAGVIAAYLMLHPCRKIWVLALMRFPIKLAAEWALGFWIVVQFLNAFFSADETVAWWTHIGGLIAGALLVIVLRLPGVKLFDCDQDRLLKAKPRAEIAT
jgi:membrane associated rhomboid family serine protease